MKASVLDRYHNGLHTLPRPGNGCHRALLGVANCGVMAGLTDGQIVADILAAIPMDGNRRVSEAEVRDAVHRARQDLSPVRPRTASFPGPASTPSWTLSGYRPVSHGQRGQPQHVDWDRVRDEIVAAGGGELDPHGPDFWESSPIQIDWPRAEDAVRFLSLMYEPDEYVFVGRRQAVGNLYCRTADEWCRLFSNELPSEQFGLLCPNPVTGQPGPTRDGRLSYRALSCIVTWRYGVAEFDRADLPRPRQLAFWRGLGLPNVAAIVDSGGKSLHVWLRLNVTAAEHWAKAVKPLFARLAALGVDAAGATGGQLCRLPGAPRPDKGTVQRLLWLCPEGGRLL